MKRMTESLIKQTPLSYVIDCAKVNTELSLNIKGYI